jgi:NifU-like protein
MAAMTIAGIQQRLMEVMGEFIKVVPASQMPKEAAVGA